MKIVQLNLTCGTGSTGRLCLAISRMLTHQGVENYILYSQGRSDYPLGIPYSNRAYKKLQALKSRISCSYGFQSRLATVRLLRHLKRLQPDIVHIHNIHGHDCHLGMLLDYLKKHRIRVVWTFHDCWVFTGLCTHFDFVGCQRWKDGCGQCPQRRQASWFFDRSAALWRRKQRALSGLDLTVVTPSAWLAGLVKDSFLGGCPVCVVPNGIDLGVFHPTPCPLPLRAFESQKIVLGVADNWTDRKGLDVFQALSRRLGPEYRIVLVGTDAKVEARMPDEILCIRRTADPQTLAGLYAAADVFVNPTREDTYPTVNLEALACGTPVVTFRTGGSAEMLDATCGCAVARDDLQALEAEVCRICTDRPYSWAACVAHAAEFDQNARLLPYLNIYRSLL